MAQTDELESIGDISQIAVPGTDDKHYPYRPLMEFRLLVVHPAPFDEPEIICDIVHESLGQDPLPAYETISYCWGDATSRANLLIDGHEFSVPASSAAAIRHMRYTDKPRTLWLDAVCINQKDLDERTHQVTLMGKIFRNSTRNLIYLGEDDENTEPALRSMRNILEDARKGTDDFQMMWKVTYDAILRDWAYSPKKMDAEIDVKALIAFLNKPWFQRLWVIQECALAPESTCIYGSHTIPYLDIVRACIWLRHKSYWLPREVMDAAGILNASISYSLVDPHNGCNYRVLDYGLSAIVLYKTQMSFLAADPKDRVYSLNELRRPVPPKPRPKEPPSDPRLARLLFLEQHRASELFRLTQPAIYPDYTRDASEVFLDATRRSASEGGEGTDILRFVNHSPGTELGIEKPSWVPVWDYYASMPPAPAILSDSFQAHDTVQQPTKDLKEQRVQRLLELQGIYMGRVTGFVRPYASSSDPQAELPAYVYLEWLNKVDELAESANIDADAVTSSLLGGFDREKQRLTPETYAERQAYVTYLKQNKQLPPAYKSDEVAKADLLTRQASHFHEQFKATCQYRTFFISDAGWCGVGPEILATGDILTIIYGTRVPFALRPTIGRDYHLLGECYAHGQMYGEAVRAHRESGRPDDTFRLF